MENKYNLTQEQNVFLAKRNIIDNIYANARMEGLNVTFPQTKTILEGVNVPNLKIDEIQVILNLRDAWNYVINNIEEKFNLKFICKVNEFVARNESIEWGVLRKGIVERALPPYGRTTLLFARSGALFPAVPHPGEEQTED